MASVFKQEQRQAVQEFVHEAVEAKFKDLGGSFGGQDLQQVKLEPQYLLAPGRSD